MAEPDPNNPGYGTDGNPLQQGTISAVGVAAGAHISGNIEHAKKLEAVMTQAIVDAQTAGITDQDELRTRILAARDNVTP